MKTIRNLIVSAGAFLILLSATPAATPVTVYMIGDSTMANKSPEKHPEMGWGQALGEYFTQAVTVDNRAMDGRSSRSFMEEGRWKSILNTLKPNDYVFIQFGHNDEKVDTPRGTTLYDYKQNLKTFIGETRAKKAIPVLLTPVTRRTFTDGKLVNSHGAYPDAAREVAKEEQVAFIDALQISEQIVTGLGIEPSKKLYLWVEPGEYSYYPDGKKDNTHFTSEGAHAIAGAIAEEIRKMNLPLSKLLK